MTSWRTTNRATVTALAVALATLFLTPSWRGYDAGSAAAVRASHARTAVPVVLAAAEVDPVSDRAACGDPCPGATAPGVLPPDVVPVGCLPAGAGTSSRPRVDIQTCALRAPPLA